MYFLLLLCAFADPTTEAIELSRKGDHEASEALFKKSKANDVKTDFYKLVNAYSLNKKAEAMRLADNVIHAFDEVPRRYHDLAVIMKADMQTWKSDPDDLDDIAREMTKAKNRLDNNKGGAGTQKIQKDVEKRLAAMIKKIEDERDAAAKAKEEAEKKEREERQAIPAFEVPKDTPKGNENGPGQVDQKKLKNLADSWGKLPEKERAKALVELLRNLPSKDKAVVHRYFDELQKRKK